MDAFPGLILTDGLLIGLPIHSAFYFLTRAVDFPFVN